MCAQQRISKPFLVMSVRRLEIRVFARQHQYHFAEFWRQVDIMVGHCLATRVGPVPTDITARDKTPRCSLSIAGHRKQSKTGGVKAWE